MLNPNDPAFPFEGCTSLIDRELLNQVGPENAAKIATISKRYDGLTKREYFAAIAMQGMIAGSQGLHITVEQFASQSLKLADALIAELNK